MKSLRILTLVLVAASVFGSCAKELTDLPDITSGSETISFGMDGSFSAKVETKATEVTSLSSFYVTAVTGSAGSESNVWNSVQFNQVPGSSPATYAGDKFWPSSDPGYKFYGSNVALNFAAGGTYVNASNATDVVCAYLSSPTYKTKNTLTFEHIFARLCRVDVAAQTGYTVSNISMYITPKTGGTYNLRTGAGHTDGTGWSSVATGSATLISDKTGATNNDIYMVPGNYTITCTWTATDASGASVTHTNKSSTLPIKGGATNNISVVLGGDILLGVDLQDYCEYDYRDNLDYLTFYCDEAGTIGWECSGASIARTIQYSKDFGSTWTNLTSTTSGATVSVSAGDIVWFKGSNTAYANYLFNSNTFTLSNKAHVYGNVNSLTGNNTSVSRNCFSSLFAGCSKLYTYEHKKIILPATTLATSCYSEMFYGCTSLTVAPELPATTLVSYCYSLMFSGCTSLTAAPELPATTMKGSCYDCMFERCTSLTAAPELPATTLAAGCYSSMFSGCTSLTATPELPATTLADGCYYFMFSGCTSLTAAPELPATTLAASCYSYMFEVCTSITAAPELPATTLVDYCYDGMFKGCSSLNYIKAFFTTTPSSSYTNNWVSGVASTGTFVKSAAATWKVTGNNGVPTGWTVKAETPGPGQWMDNPDNYLRFKFVTDGQVRWQNKKGDIQYSKNGGAWTSFNGTVVPMSAGDEIWFKGDLTGGVGASWEDSSSKFYTSGKLYVSGNVQSLCSFNNTLQNFHFGYLFSNCAGLNIDSETSLNLPATTLAASCYGSMFSSCSSLTAAPALPATTLATTCYNDMFSRCTSLTSAPELPATTLANYCYNNMFKNCTSLTTAPELPAMTLAESCYSNMFEGCISLTTAPELPAMTMKNYCYQNMFNNCTSLTAAPALPATTLAASCYGSMFSSCTSLTVAPALPATTLATSCYSFMFSGCTSLTTAPELPATTLADYCYDGMFLGCSSLNYIKALFTTTPSYDYTGGWVSDVAPTGTFVKSAAATWDVTGDYGVPTGWTVVTN